MDHFRKFRHYALIAILILELLATSGCSPPPPTLPMPTPTATQTQKPTQLETPNLDEPAQNNSSNLEAHFIDVGQGGQRIRLPT